MADILKGNNVPPYLLSLVDLTLSPRQNFCIRISRVFVHLFVSFVTLSEKNRHGDEAIVDLIVRT